MLITYIALQTLAGLTKKGLLGMQLHFTVMVVTSHLFEGGDVNLVLLYAC